MTRADVSTNRRFVICGDCGLTLCRRQAMRIRRFGDSLFEPPQHRVYELVWDSDWHIVGIGAEAHVERSATGQDRLARGERPHRRGWSGSVRRAGETSRGFPERYPAQCPRCGAINTIEPKHLDLA